MSTTPNRELTQTAPCTGEILLSTLYGILYGIGVILLLLTAVILTLDAQTVADLQTILLDQTVPAEHLANSGH